MGSPLQLPLQDIVDVTVLIAPPGNSPPTFNIGAICGSTAFTPPAGSTTHATRMILVTAAAQLLTQGYTTSSPEYIAAQQYFAQTPAPASLYVGYQDPSSILAVSVGTTGSGGSNYTVGDILGVTQAGASQGRVSVATVGAGGAVTGLTVQTLSDGTGYSVANNLATTNYQVANPAATGCTVHVTAVGETPLIALENCRYLFPQWYGYYSTTAADADAQAIALYAESAQPVMKYYYTSGTQAIQTSSTTDVMSYLQANDFSRTEGIYSTTQGGFAPNNIYASAASMGMEMGLNTGLPGSYFTKWGKPLVGVVPEPLSQGQFNTITGKNCNVYTTYVGPYSIFTPGKMANGDYCDLRLFLDVLVAQIQYTIMNYLTSVLAVPITDPGEQDVIHCVNQAAQDLAEIGFLSSGFWNGVNFLPPLNLVSGTPIPGGYLAQALPIALLSAAARAARQLQPIILAIICTDAAQSVAVGVYVQP
jgi:hypothetical protein